MVKIDRYEVLEGLYYSKDWMWLKIEGSKVRIGITDYAQKQLNEVVFVELPKVGDVVTKGESFGSVESLKTISDLVSPINGKIEEVNEEVKDNPEILNKNPYKEGWLIVLSPKSLEEDLKTLMDFKKAVEWHKELAKEK